jgi:hypothetical protein
VLLCAKEVRGKIWTRRSLFVALGCPIRLRPLKPADTQNLSLRPSRLVSGRVRTVASAKASGTFVLRPGVQYLDRWLRRASAVESHLASEIASCAQATTEARAYVKTFIAAFDVGAGVEAAAQLVAYAKGMAGGKIPVPARADKNPGVEELKDELAAYRRRLDRADKEALNVAVAATSRRTRSPGSPRSSAAEQLAECGRPA